MSKLINKIKSLQNRNCSSKRIVAESIILFFAFNILLLFVTNGFDNIIQTWSEPILFSFSGYLITSAYIVFMSGEKSVSNIIKTYIVIMIVQMILMYGASYSIKDEIIYKDNLFIVAVLTVSIIDTFILYLMLSVPFIKNIYVKRKVKRNS